MLFTSQRAALLGALFIAFSPAQAALPEATFQIFAQGLPAALGSPAGGSFTLTTTFEMRAITAADLAPGSPLKGVAEVDDGFGVSAPGRAGELITFDRAFGLDGEPLEARLEQGSVLVGGLFNGVPPAQADFALVLQEEGFLDSAGDHTFKLVVLHAQGRFVDPLATLNGLEPPLLSFFLDGVKVYETADFSVDLLNVRGLPDIPTSAVPEPASVLMLLPGLGLMAAFRRASLRAAHA